MPGAITYSFTSSAMLTSGRHRRRTCQSAPASRQPVDGRQGAALCQSDDPMTHGGEERLVADGQRVEVAVDRSGKGRLKISIS
ncbi:MAG TPA: hypothetical protein VGF60_22325 [Xanthobacteraceae bacterium]